MLGEIGVADTPEKCIVVAMKVLDPFDIALLNALQADNRATADALARTVALSPSAITRRIRRLKDSGVIDRDVSVLSPALAGRRLSAIVQIQLHDHAEEAGLAVLRQRLLASNHVQSCLEVSGSFDLFLTVTARDMAEFNAFADTMLAKDAAIRRYETSFVKKALKQTLAIPLDARDAG
ncbi:transcriptional regulator, AsnC family [Allosphingosinicella indica]|uniref:Transcriptional regulator, AsnC family n=2 Tax=Allosphingosinicella indica TaxID=941907 RepID=A0A1X7FZK8_9SPHN|nr:transcriptional regulator, AsnC family [Allosphingosinicella indica]